MYLAENYGKFDISRDIRTRINKIVDILTEPSPNKNEARDLLFKDTKFQSTYEDYSHNQKWDITYSLIKDHMQGEVAVDVGSGKNMLAYKLVEKNKELKKVIGTDIFDYHVQRENPKVEFRKQQDPLILPFSKNFADIVIIQCALHHMTDKTQLTLLREVFRILKLDGKALIIENTYPQTEKFLTNIKQQDLTKLSKEFLKLTNKQQMEFFKFMDWYANIVVKGLEDMLIPFNFKTIEEWHNIFKKVHFNVDHFKFFGFTPGRFHLFATGLFDLSKISSPITNNSIIPNVRQAIL